MLERCYPLFQSDTDVLSQYPTLPVLIHPFFELFYWLEFDDYQEQLPLIKTFIDAVAQELAPEEIHDAFTDISSFDCSPPEVFTISTPLLSLSFTISQKHTNTTNLGGRDI